jgi:hypothetical protein
MKKVIMLMAVVGIFAFNGVKAQTTAEVQVPVKIDYKGQPIVDMDLDGLTDQAEIQIYKTDPNNADTDGDTYFDGAEVMAGSDPLDAFSIPGLPAMADDAAVNAATSTAVETPWTWYISRATGLVSFSLLYLSIFLGLTIRVPFMRKAFAPLFALQGHCWIAFQAILFALIHAVMLMFHAYTNFRLVDILIPYASPLWPGTIALGIVGFYLMVILTASSYARKYMSQKLWRGLHFANIILYGVVVAHAFLLGTDMKNELIRNIFIYANVFLVIMMLINMFTRIATNVARKNAAVPTQNV